MTAAADLLHWLTDQGFILTPAGDSIKVRPGDRVTPELRAILVQHKDELLKLLRASQQATPDVDPPRRWQPGDRPSNRYEAMRDLGIDPDGDW